MIEIPDGWMNLWKIKLSGKIKYIKHGFTDNSYLELQNAINVVTEIININTRRQEY